MRIAFTRWRSGGLLNRPSPRKRLRPKKKTSSGFELVSGLADGASAMPAKWSRPVFSFRFCEGKISRALIVSGDLRAIERRVDFGSLFGLPKFLCSDHSRDDNESCGANECGCLQSRMYYSAACLQTAVLEHSTFECLWANCAGRSHCSQGAARGTL